MQHRFSRFAIVLALSLFMLAALTGYRVEASRLAPVGGRSAGPEAVLYSQPVNPKGGIILSSKRDPNGSAADQYAWDAFLLDANQAITEVRWRGAYDPARFGSGGRVTGFIVDFYASVGGGLPDVGAGPLAHYEFNHNAGESAAGTVAGAQKYDYGVALPRPFAAAAGTRYWIQIEALQANSPDWGLSAGIGGDGVYYRRIPGQGENYQLVSGDTAFTLLGAGSDRARVFLPLVAR